MPNLVFASDGAGATALTPATAATSLFDIVGTGSVTVDTTVKRHGYGSLTFDSGANVSAYVVKQNVLADAGRRIQFSARFSSFPGASNTDMVRLLTSGNATVASLRVDNTGLLKIYGGASGTTLLATAASAISTDTWYTITYCYKITSASVSEWRVFLDGTQVLTASNPASQVTASSRIRIGWSGTGAGTNKIWKGQDFYIDDGTTLDFPGEYRTTNKMAAGLGSLNNFDTAVGTGTNRWDRVNEVPANTANRYTQAATAQQSEQYTVQAASVGHDDLTGASIVSWYPWVYWTLVAAQGSTLGSIWAGGTAVTLTTVSGSGVYQAQGSPVTSTSYPSGNTDVGLRSSGTTVDVSLAEAGIIVVYMDAVAGTDRPPAKMLQSIGDARTRPRKRRSVQPLFRIPKDIPVPPPDDRLHPIPTIVADFRRRIRRGIPAKWYRPLRLAPTTIITVDAAATTGSGTAITSLTFSTTTGGGSNRYLEVALHNRAPGGHAASTSVTWNGVSMFFVDRAVIQSDHSIEIWYLPNPAASTTANVIAAFPDTRSVVGGAQHFANVDQTTPFDIINKGGATSGTPTVTTSGAAVGDMILSYIQRITSEAVEAPGDMTQAYQVNTGSGDVKGAAAYQASDGNRPTTWKYITSTYWTVLSHDLNPAPPSTGAIHIGKLRQIFTRFPYRQVQ